MISKEDKELLIKDLCMRVPYGVIVKTTLMSFILGKKAEPIAIPLTSVDPLRRTFSVGNKYSETAGVSLFFREGSKFESLRCQPYLRPLSSMTDKEREEWADSYTKLLLEVEKIEDSEKAIELIAQAHQVSIEWLCKGNFDFNGLISKGLAIEVTKDNNPYEQ